MNTCKFPRRHDAAAFLHCRALGEQLPARGGLAKGTILPVRGMFASWLIREIIISLIVVETEMENDRQFKNCRMTVNMTVL